MGVKFDIQGFLKELDEAKAEIMAKVEQVGRDAVERAKETGDYKDRTGRLRSSNKYELTENSLKIYNDAPYASDVEARGYTVITQAALEAEAKLRQ